MTPSLLPSELPLPTLAVGGQLATGVLSRWALLSPHLLQGWDSQA